jgi:hypothetical protein
VAVFKLRDWDWGLVRIWGKLSSGGLQTWGLELGARNNLGKIKKWLSSNLGNGIWGELVRTWGKLRSGGLQTSGLG